MRPLVIRNRSRPNATLRLRLRLASPLVAFLGTTVALLVATAGGLGAIRGVELTTDSTPLAVAGRSTLAVVGYVDLGQQHLYVTAESLLLVALATVLVSRGGLATVVGVLLGAGTAGGLVVVTGCPCGSGGAEPLWQVLR